MSISTIFAKPIDRPIEGVIKADDAASLRVEVEEYVLTNEVAKRLEEFLGAYIRYTHANGVWISGFFGSGKSHLLKMLALLLENYRVDGEPVLDLFLAKAEVKDNEILRGDLKRAVAIPSKSILFNIDQKADVISKTQLDALLAVFVKVFDEMCGYYGKQGHIAQFERDLDRRGQYAAFKAAFQAQSGLTWEAGREQALLEGHNIAVAYARATSVPEASASGVLDKYRAQYKMSIEDFANAVDDYIHRQGPDFRLNFFVDEVGQYIADNVKLMTNLQTIAESLATKSRGRAWLVVTAQEEMDNVIGEMTEKQSNDFSKIQARFANRMKLTSADVAEVIRRRLLLKNERGIDQLSELYAREQNNFKTLFDFVDGSQTYRNFRSRDEFIHSYPFIPYQFSLFQSAIRNLSQHNAFEGKNRSVGERSMLEVFQLVAVRVDKRAVGQLATFDLMFEGIRSTLKTQIQSAILTAESNLGDPFAVQVLKALFLVKYVKEFKATARNLTVLMLDRLDADLPALRRRIEEALNLLEQQTYIQRNGDLYAYLTNEEKDIEQEIKNTEVDSEAVTSELDKLIFDNVLRDRKVRYDENGQDYAFARRIDDHLMSRESELTIHVISPFHEHASDSAILRAHSMGRDELLVILPLTDRLMRDLLMYKRTEKYIRQNLTITQQEAVKRILNDKQFQNQERYTELRKLVADQVGQAALVVNGQDIEVGGSDPQTRLVRGFHALLVRTYPNLRMLRGINYIEADIGRHLRPPAGLYGDDGATASEAEQEMLAFVQSNNRSGLRTTLLGLVQRFERKPYGWYLAAIQCTLAKLGARGKIEARRDSTLLEDQALEQALRNTRDFANVLLQPQIDFTAAQMYQLRIFYADFFDGPPLANEARALGQETASAFQALAQEIALLVGQVDAYPFLAVVAEPAVLIQSVTGQPYAFYLTELRDHADDLFAAKERILDPVRRFMIGVPRQIYSDARQYLLAQEANLAYVEGDEAEQIQTILDDPACYQGNRMTQVKTLLDSLRVKVTAAVEKERGALLFALDARWERLAAMAEFGDLAPDQEAQLRRPFAALQRTLARQGLIAVLRDTLRRFDEIEYQSVLRQMATWSNEARRPVEYPVDGGGDSTPAPTVIVEPPIQYITPAQLAVTFDKVALADEQDVDRYLAALKQAFMQAIGAGKHVQIS